MSYAQASAEQPGRMIPELFNRKYEIDATYELLDRREVTPDSAKAGHRGLVKSELRQPGRYPLIEDTTFPSFSHRKRAVPGLDPIGGSEERQHGFLLHWVWPCPPRVGLSPTRPGTGRRC